MGIKMYQQWCQSHTEMSEHVRKFFKFQCQNLVLNFRSSSSKTAKQNAEKVEKMKQYIEEAKSMSVVLKSKLPNTIVMFPLLVAHFSEDQDLLFRVFDIAEKDDTIKSSIPPTPILVVKGKCLYDESAKCYVCIEKQNMIETIDVLEGLYITFVSYYCFGYSYPTNLSKTLEFIQRIMFKINPQDEKRR
ncbi:uncharacterized protein LOC127291533 [Leptopilina boulardi]|uniref:uncharacterized protein LOC127291533 n=1 Tax=Leptopilina boulardi TaxID=63433 RepID=UPI0021F616B5|nr:uncharacterized protein LOC127291533 [Leptopilina boulardi]